VVGIDQFGLTGGLRQDAEPAERIDPLKVWIADGLTLARLTP
jgi:hypothetical protein